MRSSNSLRLANFLATVSQAVMGRVDQQLLQHPNQTSSSLAALNVIGMYEGCSNTALGKAIGLSHTATVRLVDKLENQGLVVSTPGLDRRSVQFALTESGTAYVRELLTARCVAAGELLTLLDDNEQGQLNDIMEKLLSRMAGKPTGRGELCRLCDQVACPPDRCPAHRHSAEHV